MYFRISFIFIQNAERRPLDLKLRVAIENHFSVELN